MAEIAKIRGEPLNRGDVIYGQDGQRWVFEFTTTAGKISARREGERAFSAFLPPSSFIDVTIEEA